MADQDNVELFVRVLGLSRKKAEETAKNRQLCANLLRLISSAQTHLATTSADADLGKAAAILYNCAAKMKRPTSEHLDVLGAYIADGRISSDVRLAAALEHLLSHPASMTSADCLAEDRLALERSCGVGVTVTDAQLKQTVADVLAAKSSQLHAERYSYGIGRLLGEARRLQPWADGGDLKREMDAQLLALLGPQTADDRARASQAKAGSGGGKNKNKSAAAGDGRQDSLKKQADNEDSNGKREGDGDTSGNIVEMMRKLTFHRPGENYKTDGYVMTPTTMQHMQHHLATTAGQVRTRFPPEPNGLLHIGHAKAININFGYAAAHGGVCLLRYDDTNPEKEEARFFQAIGDMIDWLGYRPHRVTHSSDHFDQLFEWACQLIDQGQAFVCHQSGDEMRGRDPAPSPWRDRPSHESRRLFDDMRGGRVAEGAATLRLKLTLEEGKQDPVAYRVKFVPHHRTGSRWCVYPTYDYAHALCDSIEQITHSMCTKEFASRRSSYYWLCNALDVYCPVQWEYGRLNVGYTVVSKRKIARLIDDGVVADWDDPRLLTLAALRRRGVPATAINAFCARLGVTGAQMTIEPALLDAMTRDVLNATAPRRMVVLDPLPVIVENWPHDMPALLDVPDFPSAAGGGGSEGGGSGTHQVRLTDRLYIERDDYRSTAEAGFRRLTAGQPVGLRHAGLVIRLVREELAAGGGGVEALRVSCTRVGDPQTTKPKAFIHWVCEPKRCRVRLYERLFHHQNPEDVQEVPGGFMTDVNRDSLVEKLGMLDQSVSGDVYDKFQFERVGFFSVDPDSSERELVFNRTVSLREDSSKN